MLKTLKPGAIVAEGWLREQLIRSREGMGGHLDELEPAMLRDPYLRHSSDKGWGESIQAGWGAEISGNFWFAEVVLAYSLDDEGLKKKVTDWVDGVLAARFPDGYMGTYTEQDDRFDDYNAWGTACGMRALLLYHDATGRQDVLDAVHDCLLWFCRNWAGDRKTRYAGGYIIEPLVWCYSLTGDKRLLDFAKEYEDWLCENDLFESSKNAYLSDAYHYNSNHTAGYANMVRLPGVLYPFTRDESDLRASVNGVRKLRHYSVHTSGAPCCNYEYLSPRDVNGDSEYCAFTFLHSTYAVLAGLTGEAKYGDWMEEIVFNAAEGARRKDEKSIGYMTTPNQTFIGPQTSSYTNDPHAAYAPVHPVSCCVVNSIAIVPDYVRNMMMTDGEGLYAVAYGPARVSFKGLTVREETLYPFRQSVAFTAEGEGECPFCLKVPEWADGWTLTRNGEGVDAERDEKGFLHTRIAAGDRLEIRFEAHPVALLVDDDDAAGHHPMSFKYGALTFVLHLKEHWYVEGDELARTPLPEGWHWWAAVPLVTGTPKRAPYEGNGYAKEDMYWNVAVDEKRVEESLRVVEREPDGYVWENPPLVMEMDAYKAPYLVAPYPHKTFEIYGDRQLVTRPLKLTLEPYGASNLRITYFPRADVD